LVVGSEVTRRLLSTRVTFSKPEAAGIVMA